MELDKRKRRRMARGAVRTISGADFAAAYTRAAEVLVNAAATFMRGMGEAFDKAGTTCRNMADNMQPMEVGEGAKEWDVVDVGWGYSVGERVKVDGVAGSRQRDSRHVLATYGRETAEKIVELMQNDQLKYYRRNHPEKVTSHNDAADALAYAAKTCDESGAMINDGVYG